MMLADIGLALVTGTGMFLPGLAAALWAPASLPGRFLITPLFGQALAGWIIETSYLLEIPVQLATGLVAAATIVTIAWRWRAIAGAFGEIAAAGVLYACAYAGGLAALALQPWPAAGPWSADWYSYWLQLNYLLTGAPMTGWELARPPLFAAACVPAALVLPSLKALEVGAAALAASSLLVVRWASERLARNGPPPVSGLFIVGLSPLFLISLTAVVPKLPQGALILAAFLLLIAPASRRTGTAALGAAFIALALAIHQSTLAYGLAFMAAICVFAHGDLRRTVGLLSLAGVIVGVLTGLPEAMRIERFGLADIIRYNPSVAMRSHTSPPLLFLLNLGSYFGGWAYLLPAWNIIKLHPAMNWQSVGYYLNWFALVHQALVSNTLILILAPLALGWARLKRYAHRVGSSTPRSVLLGLAIAIPILAWLHPYESATGLVHAGGTALALWGFALGLALLSDEGSSAKMPMAVTLLFGSLWWVGWVLAQQWLVLRSGDAANAPQLDDLDQHFLVMTGQSPWGAGFPWPALVLATLAALIGYTLVRRSSVARVPRMA